MIQMKLLLRSLLLPLGVGLLGSLIVGRQARDLYLLLVKPPFSPPGVLFPIVWTVLYLLMGISAYLMAQKAPQNAAFRRLYRFQLLLNLLWAPLFFRACWFGWALVDLGALAITLLVLLAVICRSSKTAALLQLPYLVWVLFAGYLNYGILMLN